MIMTSPFHIQNAYNVRKFTSLHLRPFKQKSTESNESNILYGFCTVEYSFSLERLILWVAARMENLPFFVTICELWIRQLLWQSKDFNRFKKNKARERKKKKGE